MAALWIGARGDRHTPLSMPSFFDRDRLEPVEGRPRGREMTTAVDGPCPGIPGVLVWAALFSFDLFHHHRRTMLRFFPFAVDAQTVPGHCERELDVCAPLQRASRQDLAPDT
jgi:hypothetical protein